MHTDNAEYIWKWLWEQLGNAYGVAGLMGNLAAESGLRPDNLQNNCEKKLGMSDAEYVKAVDGLRYQKDSFVSDKAGFGIAQWSYWSRKKGLYEYAENTGRSIADLDMQLEYLMREMAHDYKDVYNALLCARSVREASDVVLLKYEKPANQSAENCAARAAVGQKYYDQFAVVDRMNAKAEKIVELAKERLGCPYKLGASGETIKGKQTFDCRGFTWWLLKQVGSQISQVGATTQYNTVSDWAERGLIADMPDIVCCVFMHDKTTEGKMSHTGMHIGGGQIIHCTSNGGVKYGDTSNKSWTHYAIPKGIYSVEELKRARGKMTRTLKAGCSGDDVVELQKALKSFGYDCGYADGVFGAKTTAAVVGFQRDNGLTIDGAVGQKTKAAIDAKSKQEKTEDFISVRRSVIEQMYRTCAELLVVDARSGNISNIDYQ